MTCSAYRYETYLHNTGSSKSATYGTAMAINDQLRKGETIKVYGPRSSVDVTTHMGIKLLV